MKNPELSKQCIESRLSSIIVDGKLEKKCFTGQTSFYVKKLENELSPKTDKSILAPKSNSPIICRTPSQLTFIEIEYHQNEITRLYEKLRELATEMKVMKSFIIEQMLLVKNSVDDKYVNNTQLHEKPNEKYLTKEIYHLREENKTKNCIIQTLMENQNNLLKRKFIDGNHSVMFFMLYVQSENFITPRHYVKNRDARKSFMVDSRNQFQPLENVIEKQPNNNELNIAQETPNNPRNDSTMTAENFVKKLPSRIDHAESNFASSDVANCINNFRRSEKQNAEKNIATISANYEKIINCRRLHCLKKKKKKKYKIHYNGKIDSWSNNGGNEPPCQRLYG